MNLSDSPLGVKRRLKIVGFLEWNDEEKFIICKFLVEAIDAHGNLLTDKVVNQRREVRYVVRNENKVNAQFIPVQNGGSGEYDFIMTYLESNYLVPTYALLATKLNERGIFN